MPTRAAWNAPASPPVVPRPAVPAEGVGAYLETETPTPQVAPALRALGEIGATWARNEIPWGAVEPRPGVFRWEKWDRVVDNLRARDYHILGMLCYWTPWVKPHSDEAIAAFGRYSERLARRYRGRVAAWEVWNEPNLHDYWQSTPERYVQLMRAAYEGVKRGDPDAIVVGGSLSGVDMVYLRRILAAGGARWMDALSVHPYTFGWLPEDSYLLRELRGASAAMAAAGRSPSLWVTEIARGRAKAFWLERTGILIRQSRVVPAWFWFSLYCGDAALYAPDWQPTHRAHAYRNLAGRLRGLSALGSCLPADLTPPGGAGLPNAHAPAQAWCFEGGEGIQRAAWVPVGRTTAPVLADAAGQEVVLSTRPRWDAVRGARQ